MKRDADVRGRADRDTFTGDADRPDPERPGAQWLIAGIALVVGLLGGIALGALLARDGGPLAEDGNGDAALPAACRAAIDEARTELAARERALSIPSELTAVLDRAAGAITSIDTAELEQILTDLEALANEARSAAEELRSEDFDELAEACESAANGDVAGTS